MVARTALYEVAYLPTPAVHSSAWVGHLVASLCLSVCPRSKRKMAWAISTKVGTYYSP